MTGSLAGNLVVGTSNPAWYAEQRGEVIVSRETPTNCSKCGVGNAGAMIRTCTGHLEFSSQLGLPVTLAGRKKQADYWKKYYPTSLMITGYDILFFWAVKMTHDGRIHFTDRCPFARISAFAGCAPQVAKKMSSPGTGPDPVALNQQYGTDAVRFTLAAMAAPGTDIAFSESRTEGYRNFANKIWNAARFLFMNLDKFEEGGAKLEELAAPEIREKAPYPYAERVPLIDAWLFARLADTLDVVKDALETQRFHEAVQSIYQFFWNDFCDWYIEWIKPELINADRARATIAWQNLFAAFEAAGGDCCTR